MLVGAFATMDELDERSGFHLYCLEVAMGFKRIYKELHEGNDPPGLQKAELQKNSAHVSYDITVNEIREWKIGAKIHGDVTSALGKIAELKTQDTRSLNAARGENAAQKRQLDATKQSIAEAIKNWGDELEKRVTNEKKNWDKEKDRLTTNIDKLKREMANEKIASQSQNSAMEAQMDAAKEALVKSEQDKADLKAASKMSEKLDGIEATLKASLKRLEATDAGLVGYIKSLLPTYNTGGSMPFIPPDDIKIIKDLLPKEITAGVTQTTIDAKNLEIEELKKEIENLKQKQTELEADLALEQERVTASSLVADELLAEQKKVKDQTALREQLMASITAIESFMMNIVNFSSKIKFDDIGFDPTVINTHMSSIDAAVFPIGATKKKWEKIKKVMRIFSEYAITFKAYYAVRQIISPSKDHTILKNIEKARAAFTDEGTKKEFLQLSAASYGFESPKKAMDCLLDASTKLGFENDKKCIFKLNAAESREEPNVFFTIKNRDVDGYTPPPLAVQIIDFATNKYCLLAASMNFATRWMIKSTNNDTKIKIANSMIAFVENLTTLRQEPNSETLIESIKDQIYVKIFQVFPPMILAQVLYDCMPPNCNIELSSDESITLKKCKSIVQDYVSWISDTKNSPKKFTPSEKQILKNLLCNVDFLPSS